MQEKIEYLKIASKEELEGEDRILLEIDNKEILLVQHEGSFFAVENVCSHDGAPLGDAHIEDGEIVCPRHGARFNLNSGEATALPAVVGIPVYRVKIEDGVLYLGIPA